MAVYLFYYSKMSIFARLKTMERTPLMIESRLGGFRKASCSRFSFI